MIFVGGTFIANPVERRPTILWRYSIKRFPCRLLELFGLSHAEILLASHSWRFCLKHNIYCHPRPLQQIGLKTPNGKTEPFAHQRTNHGQQLLLWTRQRGVADVICWTGSFTASKKFPWNDPDELDGPVFKSTHPPIQSLPILSIASGIIRLAIAQGEREWAQGVIITCFAHLCTC